MLNLNTPTPYIKKDAPADPPQEVLIVAILDRSGSMANRVDEVIGGFNAFMKQHQDAPGRASFSLVLFDNVLEVPVHDAPVKQFNQLDRTNFVPRGGTALLDAIGFTMSRIDAQQRGRRVICCIVTDGEENSSRTFSTMAIRQMIEVRQGQGWEIIYLGANQDSFAVAEQYGFKRSTVANYSNAPGGLMKAFSASTVASMSSRLTGNVAADWRKSIDDADNSKAAS